MKNFQAQKCSDSWLVYIKESHTVGTLDEVKKLVKQEGMSIKMKMTSKEKQTHKEKGYGGKMKTITEIVETDEVIKVYGD